jgi:ketol-acid reductoisomerase
MLPTPDSRLLLEYPVAVIGFGNQGRAQALNLRDSGANVVVGLRNGSPRRALAESDGLRTASIEGAVDEAAMVAMLVPDMKMAEAFSGVGPALKAEKALLFAHGFAIVYGLISPPSDVDVLLVSPKGVGTGVRRKFEEGGGVPGLIGVHQNATGQAWERACSYAWGLGCARSLLLETTFQEETETDLFGEQAVLCGGIPNLIAAAFETLLQAGYRPEVAYFECLHETKLIVDLIVERGLSGMRTAISDTAQWGGLTAGPQLVTEDTRATMEELLTKIRSGEFAGAWLDEARKGSHTLDALRTIEKGLAVERFGRDVRARIQDAEEAAKAL